MTDAQERSSTVSCSWCLPSLVCRSRNASGLPLFVLDNALERTEGLAPDAVARHAQALGARLLEGLTARGRKVITPEVPAERAGNVCFLAEDARGLADRLAARQVLVWGGDGVSAHLYNDADDVAAFLAAMDEVG